MGGVKIPDPRPFGMTREEIIAAADELSRQSDKNSPTVSGSYTDFLKTVNTGHDALARHEGYFKSKPAGRS